MVVISWWEIKQYIQAKQALQSSHLMLGTARVRYVFLHLFPGSGATSTENMYPCVCFSINWMDPGTAKHRQLLEGGVCKKGREAFMSLWHQKNYFILRGKIEDCLGDYSVFLFPTLHSPLWFCWDWYFHCKLFFLCILPWFWLFSFCCHVVCFPLYLFLYCLFPLFFFFSLNFPPADSFCLCYLPHFILSVCSYRNRVFSARLCVCACIHSCSYFLSSSNSWTTFSQYLKERQRSKVLWK